MTKKETIRNRLTRRFYTKFKPTADRKGTMRSLAANGQRPEILIISCIDSRVSASMIFKAEPGEMLNHRHIAGLVPPYDPAWEKTGAVLPAIAASIEFAIRDLKVGTVIVKGHTYCGGIRAYIEGTAGSAVRSWMENAGPIMDRLDRSQDSEALLRQAERECVKCSFHNLLTYPAVRSARKENALVVEAWIHNIEDSVLLRLDPAQGEFIEMEENEAPALSPVESR